MEAIKFIKERYRMCHTYDECKDCPLEKDGYCIDFSNGKIEKIVELVEKWSKEHSIKKEEKKEHCCDNCKYGYLSEDEEPCTSCFRCYYDCFEPKEKKTKQSEFLKLFPDTKLDSNGIIDIKPCIIEKSLDPYFELNCGKCEYNAYDCKFAYWLEDIE